MIRNYLKTAFRSLWRNKGYTFINVAGLTTGITVCLIIFIVIRFELSFDAFHPKKDRIYRVMLKNGKGETASSIPAPMPAALKSDVPSLEVAPLFALSDIQIAVPGTNGEVSKRFKEDKGVVYTSPSFFEMFNFPWLAGNPATALKEPNSTVITQAIAEKYFGNWKNAMGKSLNIENGLIVTVTGILANIPTNTDFQFRMVLPYHRTGLSASKDWISINSAHTCYVMLPGNTTAAAIDKQLDVFAKKYRPADNLYSYALQSLGDVHFDSTTLNFSERSISHERIRTLWLIAAFILGIACVNFINLSTAQAVNRSKEIGVRKVLGSNKGQIHLQFLMETFMLVLIAVVMAVGIAGMVLKPVGNMLGITLSLHLLFTPVILLFLLITTLIVTFLAGFYPALVLSGFNPLAALKSRFAAKNTTGISLRRGLVIFQFIIAQVLIIGTLLLIKQLDYFTKTPMGFNSTAVVNVPFRNDSANISKLNYLRNQLLQVKEVSQVSFNSAPPASIGNWWTGIRFNHAVKETDFSIISKWVDTDYLSIYQIQLLAGRNITTTDSIKEFLINETLVKKLGYHDPGEVLHKEIDLWDGFIKGTVVGVVKDFHSESLKEAIAPLFIASRKEVYNQAAIRISTAQLPAAIKNIEKLWAATFPNLIFEYQFTDDQIANFYQEENQLSQLYKTFSLIAIFLSCLGLYGLVSFMTTQRIKEVGIRKVLGASAGSIVYLFSKEFVILIIIAFFMAAPIAWYIMHQWLQHFVYHIDISWWIFVAGGAGSVIIALTTISFKALKAAFTNPVDSLRSE
ncbi:ABC transporter permease [Chitinophaga defluvii]|uniref:ABC transporter permease n=1 Tax=Chitinophaga defluvii TaxID=3163343 RepID=A0ABV2TAM8_9BACT